MVRVSYILLSYNQERYIRFAIRSALSQTFCPMEIIVSDDCSVDATYSSIFDECQAYQGPNKVTINKCSENLGLIEHFNKVMQISRGQIILLAAGDDISDPTRTSRVVTEWEKTGALVFGCNPIVIDENGKALGYFYAHQPPSDFSWQSIIKRGNVGLFITAIDRKIFNQWGPLDEKLAIEDQCIAFRATLMQTNAIKIINEPLVQYRRHQDSMVSSLIFGYLKKSAIDTLLNKIYSYIFTYQSWFDDLEKADFSHIDQQEKQAYLKLLKQRIEYYKLIEKLLLDTALKNRFRIWFNAWWSNKLSWWRLGSAFGFVPSPKALGWMLSFAIQCYRGLRRGVYG